jgi:hypothetical protein
MIWLKTRSVAALVNKGGWGKGGLKSGAPPKAAL